MRRVSRPATAQGLPGAAQKEKSYWGCCLGPGLRRGIIFLSLLRSPRKIDGWGGAATAQGLPGAAQKKKLLREDGWGGRDRTSV